MRIVIPSAQLAQNAMLAEVHFNESHLNYLQALQFIMDNYS
jgi:hypothetical protein